METVFTEVNAQNARANLVLDESRSTIVDAAIVEAGQRGINHFDSMAGRYVKGNAEDQKKRAERGRAAFLNCDNGQCVMATTISLGKRHGIQS